MAGSSDIAKERLFDRVFVCMKCNAKIRADPLKVRKEKVKCRKCGNKSLRSKKRRRLVK